MTEPRCDHRLDGLEPDNLLAFLALLGLLRALEAARPDWRPRAGWQVDRAPLRPFLRLGNPVTRETVCEAAAEGLDFFRRALLPFSWPRSKKGKARRTAVCSTAARFRNLSSRIVRPLLSARKKQDARHLLWQFRHDLLVSGVVESNEDNQAMLEASPLKLPSAQMAFIGAMFEAVKNCEAIDIESSLFSIWKYETEGDSLRLAPQEARRYAYRASDPAPEGARSERGGTALGALGLTTLTLVPGIPHPKLIAYTGTRQSGFVSWPIWSEPCSINSIIALLSSLRERKGTESAPHPSVIAIVKCRRFVLDPSTGDYGNVSPGELWWWRP